MFLPAIFVWSPANFIVQFTFFLRPNIFIDCQIIAPFAKGNTSVQFLWMKLLSTFMFSWRQPSLQIGNISSNCKKWLTIKITSNMYICTLKVATIAQCPFWIAIVIIQAETWFVYLIQPLRLFSFLNHCWLFSVKYQYFHFFIKILIYSFPHIVCRSINLNQINS